MSVKKKIIRKYRLKGGCSMRMQGLESERRGKEWAGLRCKGLR